MKLFRSLLCFLMIAFAGAAHAEKGYTLVNPPQPTGSGKKIEVLEFFYYGCPHCYDLQKYLEPWLKKLPKDVEFRYVPTIFDDNWAKLAKTYYAFDSLGLEPRLHGEIYDAVQNGNLDLGDPKTLLDWGKRHGVDPAKLSAALNSFSVQVNVSKSREMTRNYGIMGTPSLVVDGKYLTSPGITRSLPETIAVLDRLIARARAERAGH